MFGLKIFLAGFLANVGFGPASLYLMRINILKGFSYTRKLIGAIICSDILYSLIALFAGSAIEPFILKRKNILLFLLGLFLWYISLKFRKKDTKNMIHIKKKKTNKALKDFMHILFLVLFHPGVLLMYIGLFATLGISHISPNIVFSVIIYVLLGAASWYIPLLRITSKARKKVSHKNIHLFLQGLTLIIFLLGCYIFLDILYLHYL